MNMKNFFLLLIFICCLLAANAQPDRWQQRVKYNMDINMDVSTNRFTGKQKLEYSNNSPDTLYKVFYHLYWNAFQPGSMMDVRSRELGKIKFNGRPDWDGRVRDRIAKLKDDEIGYQKVLSLKMNGVAQKYILHETILEVQLSKPILPRSKVVFDMDFEAQVPLQIRRSGRDNPQTGVRYTMSQWYPKMCEYDYEGWHPTPYVAREFYGVWGDFDVKITIDKKYILGGTGYLINANQIGYGYETPGIKVVQPAGDKLTWIFTAPNVHDFVWAADPEYKHLYRQLNGGPMLHVLYKYKPNNTQNDEAWANVLNAAELVYPYIKKTFGDYPYKQYSFIQGGDGGMEYPMATMLVGSGIGTVFHEWLHSWYQGMLATNESMYAWMDEGFTEYATDLVQSYYAKNADKSNPLNAGVIHYLDSTDNILPKKHADNYNSYFYLVQTGKEEPLTTHADHFNSNMAYSIAAYSKGDIFLVQLGYVVGEENLSKILLEYYRRWRFKHPNANDFVRVAEKVSGIQLDWYKEYWVNTTKTIDYSIDSLWEEGNKSKIRLRRIGQMPMPIEVMITFKDGSKELHYIPLNLMFAAKPAETKDTRFVHAEWSWTNPVYTFEFDKRLLDAVSVEIDPSQRMADVDRRNNLLELKW
jgi:hypothetical protein